MKISIAQTRSINGNISANIEKHIKFIELAVSLNADSLFFPELSLTSYEPKMAKTYAIEPENSRLDIFQKISDSSRITIGVGIPTKSNDGILISMVIFQPNKPRQTYSKQQLHPDEFPYFINGDQQIIITVGNNKVAPAICFESLQATHAERASKLGADIYMASVAKSKNSVAEALTYYPIVGKRYKMTVLMSNCIGFCDDFECIGLSSIWNNKGQLMGQLDNLTEGMLVFDTEKEEVMIKMIV